MQQDSTGVVLIVDDDPSVGAALRRLLDSVGLVSEVYLRASDCLSRFYSEVPTCAIVDVRMPDMGGLELQQQLHVRYQIPVIILSAHIDVAMAVRAMKEGAVEVLTKPFHDQDLLDAALRAIDLDRSRRQRQEELSRLTERYDTLTARERQVMALVVEGHVNRAIALQLGTSEKTIKVHRGHVMHKMRAASLAALVRFADRLILRRPSTSH